MAPDGNRGPLVRVGAPVVVTRDAGSGAFVGRRGIVVAVEPAVLVRLASEPRPLRFDASVLVPWMPREGSTVIVADRCCSFFGERGVVVRAGYHGVRVDLGGERLPIWFSPRELAPYRAAAKLSAPSRRSR